MNSISLLEHKLNNTKKPKQKSKNKNNQKLIETLDKLIAELKPIIDSLENN